MAVRMLRQWNGYEQGQVYTIGGGEEARLIAAGLARNWTPALDGASGSGLSAVQRTTGAFSAVLPDGSVLRHPTTPTIGAFEPARLRG